MNCLGNLAENCEAAHEGIKSASATVDRTTNKEHTVPGVLFQMQVSLVNHYCTESVLITKVFCYKDKV